MKEQYLSDLKLTVEQINCPDLYSEDLRAALDSEIVKICVAIITEKITFYQAIQALMGIRYMLSNLPRF